MDTIKLRTIEEFHELRKHGFNPFLDEKIEMDIFTRVKIQKEFFKSDNHFYRFCWDNMNHYCEETGLKLRSYSACFVSHILSRGAFPEMRWDMRNINILSLPEHQKWESHKKVDMYIYRKNSLRIQQLKREYNILKLLK